MDILNIDEQFGQIPNQEVAPQTKKKGGRIARLDADYFSVSKTRSDEVKELKRRFGSEGVDFYYSINEKLCGCQNFIWHFEKEFRLNSFADDYRFDIEKFNEILAYAVEELGMYDRELYEEGYIFSRQFVQTFNDAGLFKNRKTKMNDILEHAQSLLEENDSNIDEPNQTNIETHTNTETKTESETKIKNKEKEKINLDVEQSIVKESKETQLSEVNQQLSDNNPNTTDREKALEGVSDKMRERINSGEFKSEEELERYILETYSITFVDVPTLLINSRNSFRMYEINKAKDEDSIF